MKTLALAILIIGIVFFSPIAYLLGFGFYRTAYEATIKGDGSFDTKINVWHNGHRIYYESSFHYNQLVYNLDSLKSTAQPRVDSAISRYKRSIQGFQN